jgi:purine-cytosine permease-like protein
VANVWFYALGALLVLGSSTAPTPVDIAARILAFGGGSVAGILFLVGLLVGETDEAFADIYSCAVSLQNIVPRASRRALTVVVAIAGTALAALLSMDLYENFLFLLGSIFVPLFGLLIADHFFLGGRTRPETGARTTPTTNGVRLAAFVPWLAGFIVYHWIAPVGPTWWTDLTTSIFRTPLSERWPWCGASVPSFIVAFLLSLLLLRSRGRALLSGEKEQG